MECMGYYILYIIILSIEQVHTWFTGKARDGWVEFVLSKKKYVSNIFILYLNKKYNC